MSRRSDQPKTRFTASVPLRSRPATTRRNLTCCLLAVAAWLCTSSDLVIPAAAQEGVIEPVSHRELSTRRRTSRSSSSGRPTSGRANYNSGSGLLGGIFGGSSRSSSSADDDDEYRKVTPVPDLREPADWSGVPYHEADPRKLTNRDVPIRDPRNGVQPVPTRPNAAQTARGSTARRGVPTPPANVTTPRPIGRTAPSRSATEAIASGNMPEDPRLDPLSRTRSSRRTTAEPSPAPSVPDLKVARNPLTTSRGGRDAVELVPKVSRRVIRVESPDGGPSANPLSSAESSRRSVASANPSGPQTDLEKKAAPTGDVASRSAKTDAPPSAGSTGGPTVTRRELPVQRGLATDKPSTDNVASSRRAVEDPASETSDEGQSTADATATSEIRSGNSGDRVAESSRSSAIGDSPADAAGKDQFTARDRSTPSATVPRVLQRAPMSPVGFGSSRTTADAAGDTGLTPLPAGRAPSKIARSADGGASRPLTPSTPTIDVAARADAPAAETASRVASELPGIRVVTAGPRKIMIRQTHTFEIRAENRGSIDAEGLVVRAHVPDWAEVVDQQVSRGNVVGSTEGTTRQLVWKIDRLAAGDFERLSVRLRAAHSGTQQLDVDWTLVPQKDVVKVHVQEPRLALMIEGPEEVVFGESQTYRIRVRNPGDGVAPGVVFTLSPESEKPQSQPIGDIPAGKEAQFEVELTAQDVGELKIRGLAEGELELNAQADKSVRVLSADLQAVLTGPDLKYQNSEATYQLELANEGTTASKNIAAVLKLPLGVTLLQGPKEVSARDNELRWQIDSIGPGEKREYQFQVGMNATGQQRFGFECQGTAAGQTRVALATEVQAIADLVLSVEDPVAPAPIGEEVRYEVVVRNRGSKPATQVRAIAQFSHGIEPQALLGHDGKVVTGQVLIEPITQIAPGEEVRMTIVAQAHEAGHHRFRAEVRSGDTILVAEEATHYMATNRERISSRSESSTSPSLSMPRR